LLLGVFAIGLFLVFVAGTIWISRIANGVTTFGGVGLRPARRAEQVRTEQEQETQS
jgi:hypothetical protein